MAAKRHERTYARRAALALLYTSEITDEGATKIAEEGRFLAEDGPLPEYAQSLVRGIEAHRIAIDKHLSSTSENWSVARMPIVDRSILRLATYEMMYVEDVPTSVAINEAVELAKDFGGEDESPRFVNGILGRIAKHLDGDDEVSMDASGAGSELVVEGTPIVKPAVEAVFAAESVEEIAAEGATEASVETVAEFAAEGDGASKEEAHGA